MCLDSTVHLWFVDKLVIHIYMAKVLFFFFLFVVHNEELLTARQVLPAHPSLVFWVAEVWESPKSRKNKIDLVHVDPESSASVH